MQQRNKLKTQNPNKYSNREAKTWLEVKYNSIVSNFSQTRLFVSLSPSPVHIQLQGNHRFVFRATCKSTVFTYLFILFPFKPYSGKFCMWSRRCFFAGTSSKMAFARARRSDGKFVSFLEFEFCVG